MNKLSKEAVSFARDELQARQLGVSCRSDLYEFVKYTFTEYSDANWHHKLICDYYQKTILGDQPRLMIFAPPRHMKTENLERAGAWAMGKFPDWKLMSIGYGDVKSRKISNHIKSTIKSDRFSCVFWEFNRFKLFDAVDTQDYWELSSQTRGALLSAGMRGSIMGEGFNLCLLDDPFKNREEAESITIQDKIWEQYDETLKTRQDRLDSRIIIINQRWNKDDLCGKLLNIEGLRSYNGHKPDQGCPSWNGQDDGTWDVLNLQAVLETPEDLLWKHATDPRGLEEALWPSRFPLEFLTQFRRNEYNWNSNYKGDPVVRGGNWIKSDWLRVIDSTSTLVMESTILVRFWDLAGTPKEAKKQNDPDFTAGALVAFFEGNYYILDITALRATPRQVKRKMREISQRDQERYENITQVWEEEPGASGKLVTDDLQEFFGFTKRAPFRSGKAKEFYIDLFANKAETGNVYCLDGFWLRDRCDEKTFFEELRAFPKGRHDDRIDAVAKAIYYLSKQILAGQEIQTYGNSVLTTYDDVNDIF